MPAHFEEEFARLPELRQQARELAQQYDLDHATDDMQQRLDDPTEAKEPVALMVAALERAAEDAGTRALPSAPDRGRKSASKISVVITANEGTMTSICGNRS